MQGPTYKTYIRNRQGYWLFRDEIGAIQFSETKRSIVNTFDGWMNMIASIMRNKVYKGNFRKVTTPIKFVLDGKDIIDHIAVYEGPNAYVELIIEVQKPENFDYELFFYGTIDFEEGYRYSEDFTTVNIREILMIDLIEAKKNVVYSIPLTNDNSELIQMDGIELLYRSTYIVSNSFSVTAGWNTGSHIIELLYANNENPYTNETERVTFNSFPADLFGTKQPFFNGKVNAKINITYNFSFIAAWNTALSDPNANCQIRILIVVRKPNGAYNSIVIYNVEGRNNVFISGSYAQKRHTVTGVANILTEPGDQIYLVNEHINMTVGGSKCVNTYDETPAEFIVDTVQRAPATIHRAIKAWKLWQELMYRASDGKYSGVSPYLFHDENQLLTSGTALRNDEEQTIQWTISDFLKYVWVNKRGVIKDLTGNNALIAEYSETFIPNTFAHLGEVKDFEWEFDKNALVSAIEVGYENIDFGVDGQINGKDEFNQKNHFTTAQETIDATYNIVSPVIASMYAQELMRVKFGSLRTTDNKGDNKVYLIDAEKGATIQYYTGAIEFIATNTIRIAGFQSDVNGQEITITGAGSYNGTYTVTNVSYLVVGFTTITVTGAAFANGISGGEITYQAPNIYKPYRPPYVSITGVLSPTTCYNTRLSPKNLLLLHAPVIAAGVYNVNASDALDVIKFQSGDKNTKLSVSLDGVSFVTEDADERFSSLAQPYTLPIIFHFKTDYERDMFSRLIGDKRYEQIAFTQKGIELAGYIEEIHTNADTGEAQGWQLRSNVSTNLINLLIWRIS